MERARRALEMTADEANSMAKVIVHPRIPSKELSFYEDFSIRGIRVDRAEPGRLICSYRVPPRLTDRDGNMAPGAIANLVDEIGAAVMHRGEGQAMDVSVNMSISCMSTAKVDDELEITSVLRGEQGRIYLTSVFIKKKATGEVVAEGQHSVFKFKWFPSKI